MGGPEIKIASPTSYMFDPAGGNVCKEVPDYMYSEHAVGDTVAVWIASPGSGRIVYKVTRKDAEGLWGYVVSDTSQLLSPEDVV